jgi:hypothetical protein
MALMASHALSLISFRAAASAFASSSVRPSNASIASFASFLGVGADISVKKQFVVRGWAEDVEAVVVAAGVMLQEAKGTFLARHI